MSLQEAVTFLADEDPIPEGESDLSEAEAGRARETLNKFDLARKLGQQLRRGYLTLAQYEILRRKPHLYYRARLVSPDEPDRVLLFQVDWMEKA